MGATKTIAVALLATMPLLAMFSGVARDGWELMSIYGAGMAWSFLLRSWWWRGFLCLALAQLVWRPTGASMSAFAMICLFLGAAQVFSGSEPEEVSACIRISALAVGVLMLLQEAGVIPPYNPFGRPGGFFNPDAAGVYLALCLPAFLGGEKGRTLKIIFCATVAGGIFLAGSTTAMASAAAAVVTYYVLEGRLSRVLAAALVVIVGSVVFITKIDPIQSTLSEPRWQVWRHVVRTYPSAPLGRGLGSFREIFPYFVSADRRLSTIEPVMTPDGRKKLRFKTTWLQAHNEYLQAGFEMGIQGIVLILGFFVSFTVTAMRLRGALSLEARQAGAGIAALAVSCLGWFTLHIAPLALVSMAWLGIWEAEKGRTI